MYADTITWSMQQTIDETNRRREKQLRYNEEHGITPTQIRKDRTMGDLISAGQEQQTERERRAYIEPEQPVLMAAEAEMEYQTRDDLRKAVEKLRKQMQDAAKRLDFITAAQLRDQMLQLMAKLDDVPEDARARN